MDELDREKTIMRETDRETYIYRDRESEKEKREIYKKHMQQRKNERKT